MEMERLPLGESYSDKQRAAYYKWVNMPSGLTPELASKFMLNLHGGKTIRDMTTSGGDSYICSMERFRVHCRLNPEWSATVRKLSETNGNKKKSVNAARSLATRLMCLKGLHPMTADNVRVRKCGLRYCRECQRTLEKNPRIDVILPVVGKITSSLQRGQRLNATLKKYGVGIKVYTRFREINADFDTNVREALQNKGARQQVRAVQVHVARVRRQNDDYHTIRGLIPESNPHRDDILARIFEDMLGGSLKRAEVPSRIKIYVTELNRLYPTKYAKFGDGQLFSLDEVMFDGGTSTRGDYVSRSLWD